MSLRRMCREVVLEALIRRCLAAEGGELAGRIQLVVDEPTLRVLTSCLRMADLHSEGVTSVELLEREREPLPDIDALYISKPDEAKVSHILDDFKNKDNPQHDQVHLAFTDLVPVEQMERLAGGAGLAPRIRNLVEAPLTFITIEDRGFHFDMPQALPRLFPNFEHETELLRDIALRLADVCTCLQATAPEVRHAASPLCKEVAQLLQQELSSQKRPLSRSTKANDVPLIVLIVDRSVDMPATLVHEYTYEALAYDILDGSSLDIDHHIVTTPPVKKAEPDFLPSPSRLSGRHILNMKFDADEETEGEFRPSASRLSGSHILHMGYRRKSKMQGQDSEQEKAKEQKQVLLSEADAVWNLYRHDHIETVKAGLKDKIDSLRREASDNKNMSELSPQEALQELRKLPEFKELYEKLQLHTDLLTQINVRLNEFAVISSGLAYVEQDCACGIDSRGKDVKATKLQEDILNLFYREANLPSETKLRLLLLYFTCVANISEPNRKRLIDASKLDADDEEVLLAMVRTKLMEVPDSQRHKLGSDRQPQHRVTKTQAKRFKNNAITDNRFELSRFEPRVRELLEQLAENCLSEDDFPSSIVDRGAAQTGLRFAAAPAGSNVAPMAPAVDDWSFVSAPGDGNSGTNPFSATPEEVSSRIIVFVIGGVTYSELRAGVQASHSLPNGTEVFVGGTAVLTPRRLIQSLRPRTEETGGGEDAAADDKV